MSVLTCAVRLSGVYMRCVKYDGRLVPVAPRHELPVDPSLNVPLVALTAYAVYDKQRLEVFRKACLY